MLARHLGVAVLALGFLPPVRAQCELDSVVGSGVQAQDDFACSVDITGELVVIGAFDEDAGAISAGAAYAFRRVGTNWIQEWHFVSDAPKGDGYFGASLAAKGSTVAIGARYEDYSFPGSGVVHVFDGSGGNWTRTTKLVGSGVGPFSLFGATVAMDEQRIVASSNDSGDEHVWVFRRQGAGWVEETSLQSSDHQPNDGFGAAIAVEGDRIVVGANAASTTQPDSGAAYVFRFDGAQWSEEAKLVPIGPQQFGGFGSDLDSDGDTVLIGAASTGLNSQGAALVFRHLPTGWKQEAMLLASDMASNDHFGQAVGLSGDLAMIGAPDNMVTISRQGAVYYFRRTGASWKEQVRVVASDPADADKFGVTLALDADYAAIGAVDKNKTGLDSGAAYVFSASNPVESCTPKTNSLGCIPIIGSSGCASASSSSGFSIVCTRVRNQKVGLLLYGLNGIGALPFQGGTLCITPPVRRTLPSHSGGDPVPNNCSGAWRIDMNAFAAGTIGGQPMSGLSIPGNVIVCQWWGRDPGDAFGTALSGALRYLVGP